MNLPNKSLRSKRALQKEIEALIKTLREQADTGLHLGCGPDLIPGLINCDAFHPDADRKLGATDLHEFADASVDYIETHHMIEHLSFDEADAAFREWARVVRKDGLVAITCPDFSALIKRWQRSSDTENWNQTIRMFYGSQEHEGMFHKSGYDAKRLTELLGAAGFETLFHFTPYPRRPTPSLFLLARRC